LINNQIDQLNQLEANVMGAFTFIKKAISPLDEINESAQQFYRRVRPRQLQNFFRRAERTLSEASGLGDKHKETIDALSNISRKLEGTDPSSRPSSKQFSKFGEGIHFAEEFEKGGEDFDNYIDEHLRENIQRFIEEDMTEMVEEFDEMIKERIEERTEQWEEYEETSEKSFDQMERNARSAFRGAGQASDSWFDQAQTGFLGILGLMESAQIRGLIEETASEGIMGIREVEDDIQRRMGLGWEEYVDARRDMRDMYFAYLDEEYEGARGFRMFVLQDMVDAWRRLEETGIEVSQASREEITLTLMELQKVHGDVADVATREIIHLIDEYDEGREVVERFSSALGAMAKEGIEVHEEGWQIFEGLGEIVQGNVDSAEEFEEQMLAITRTLGGLRAAGVEDVGAFEDLFGTLMKGGREARELMARMEGITLEEIQRYIEHGEFDEAMIQIFGELERYADQGQIELLRALGEEMQIPESTIESIRTGRLTQEGFEESIRSSNEAIKEHTDWHEYMLEEGMRTEGMLGGITNQLKNMAMATPIISDIFDELARLNVGLDDILKFAIVFKMLKIPALLGKIGGGLATVAGFLGGKGGIAVGAKKTGGILAGVLGVKAAPVLAVLGGAMAIYKGWDWTVEKIGGALSWLGGMFYDLNTFITEKWHDLPAVLQLVTAPFYAVAEISVWIADNWEEMRERLDPLIDRARRFLAPISLLGRTLGGILRTVGELAMTSIGDWGEILGIEREDIPLIDLIDRWRELTIDDIPLLGTINKWRQLSIDDIPLLSALNKWRELGVGLDFDFPDIEDVPVVGVIYGWMTEGLGLEFRFPDIEEIPVIGTLYRWWTEGFDLDIETPGVADIPIIGRFFDDSDEMPDAPSTADVSRGTPPPTGGPSGRGGTVSTTEQQIETYTGAAPHIGSVAEHFESSGRGAGTIADTAGDIGGKSYGTYQIATETGTMDTFLNFLEGEAPEVAGMLKEHTIGSQAFDEVWTMLAESPRYDFGQMQRAFIEKSHFAPAVDRIGKSIGLDVMSRSDALQETVWSTAVQHGAAGAQRVFENARIDPSMDDATIISRVYAERGRDEGMAWFGSASPEVRQAVVDRFGREEQKVLAMLQDAEGGGRRGAVGLYTGGIAMKPVLASIAEHKPEAVIPLDKIGTVIARAQSVVSPDRGRTARTDFSDQKRPYVISDNEDVVNAVEKSADKIIDKLDNIKDTDDREEIRKKVSRDHRERGKHPLLGRVSEF